MNVHELFYLICVILMYKSVHYECTAGVYKIYILLDIIT